MRSFAIEEPGSPVPALYATLARTSSSMSAKIDKSVATSSFAPLTFAFNSAASQQRLLDFKPENLKP